jgi:RNA recognition motif-containing protein
MTKKIYVGNLPFSYGFKDLVNLFEKFGEIQEAIVIADKFNGRSKGFGFVTLTTEDSAKKAVTEMDGKEANGRVLKVKEATPKAEEPERKEEKPEKVEKKPKRESKKK